MKLLNKALAKTIAATTAAGAMAVSAVPAQANERHNDKLSTGEVVAGAVILGGLAAILASKKNDRKFDNHHDVRFDNRHNDKFNNRNRRGHNDGFRNGSRQAVRQCINQAEYKASFNGNANVTDIRDIRETRYGYRVRGNLLVTNGRGFKRYSDKGRFTCYIDNGRVSELEIRGL